MSNISEYDKMKAELLLMQKLEEGEQSARENGWLTAYEVEPKRKTIKELFSDYHGDYNPSELDWGVPVGDEIW